MSIVKTFTESIAPFYDFDPKAMEREREAMSLPVYANAPSIDESEADKKALIEAYRRGMPISKSSWYPYTEWRSFAWFSEHKPLSKSSKQEATFWMHAFTNHERWSEYTEHDPSTKKLEEQDLTEEKSYKEWLVYLDEKSRLIQAAFPNHSHLEVYTMYSHDLLTLLSILVPRAQHLEAALTIYQRGVLNAYNVTHLSLLFPVPADAEELASLQPTARKFFETIDLDAIPQAIELLERLAYTYDLRDRFSTVLEASAKQKRDFTRLLQAMLYQLGEEEQLDRLKPFRSRIEGQRLVAEVAMHGDAHLDTWMDIGQSHKGQLYWFSHASKVHHPATARLMASLAREGNYRTQAEQWLKENGANAIAGLIPLLATRGKGRETAIDLLRHYKQQGHEELIVATRDALVEETGKKQLETHVLDWSYQQKPYLTAANTPAWLEGLSKKKLAKLPSWLTSTSFPPQFLADHSAQLTPEQVMTLVEHLQSEGDSHSHSEATLGARRDLSRRELGQLAWSIFDAWLKAGTSTREKWAYLCVGHVGTSLEGQKVAPYFKIWPKQNKWRMAQDVLYIYRMIGSDGALMTLHGVTQKVKQKSVRGQAERLLKEIATARNLTPSELEDRIIPDCELDEKGCHVFDYGPRQFSLAFDSEFKPVLRDEARHKIIKSLPKPGKHDDEEMAEEARATFKAMKKQLKEVISVQTPRLESAMIAGRTWRGEDFQSLLVEHPLMCHFARRLLWGISSDDGTVQTCFRVDEENALVDAEDEPFALPPEARVCIVHPLQLTQEQLETWGTIFGDYEIFPPFLQLNRPVYDLDDEEKKDPKAVTITRFSKLKIPGISIKGFVDKSPLWRKGQAEDAGIVNVFWCTFDHLDISCTVRMELGFDISGYWSEDGGLSELYFYKGKAVTYYWGSSKKKSGVYYLKDVPKLALSEVLYSLYQFTSKYEAR